MRSRVRLHASEMEKYAGFLLHPREVVPGWKKPNIPVSGAETTAKAENIFSKRLFSSGVRSDPSVLTIFEDTPLFTLSMNPLLQRRLQYFCSDLIPETTCS